MEDNPYEPSIPVEQSSAQRLAGITTASFLSNMVLPQLVMLFLATAAFSQKLGLGPADIRMTFPLFVVLMLLQGGTVCLGVAGLLQTGKTMIGFIGGALFVALLSSIALLVVM